MFLATKLLKISGRMISINIYYCEGCELCLRQGNYVIEDDVQKIINERVDIMLKSRLKFTIITGAILGLVCIIGAGIRMGFAGNLIYLFALWYNRLLMGILIGLTDPLPKMKAIFRGALLGLLVSLAFYLSTGFSDIVTFLVGIVYGVIIAFVAMKYDKEL